MQDFCAISSTLKDFTFIKHIKEDSGNKMVVNPSCSLSMLPKQILSELSNQPIQWIPRAPIHRRNIQQQLQEYNFGENSNAPDLRLLIWVMKFKNIHFVTVTS